MQDALNGFTVRFRAAGAFNIAYDETYGYGRSLAGCL